MKTIRDTQLLAPGLNSVAQASEDPAGWLLPNK